ncbi:hypothetical protein Tco_1077254 [Tanacetum coccineum]
MESVGEIDVGKLDARMLRLKGRDARSLLSGSFSTSSLNVNAAKPSDINMLYVLGMVNVFEIFGVSIKIFEDIDELFKGIELGKYEALWSGMTSDKCKSVTDALFAMSDAFLAANPSVSTAGTPYLDKPVISGLNNDERQAAYALVLEVPREFNYVNSGMDTSSKEPMKLFSPALFKISLVLMYFAVGMHLEGLHVTWAHLEKKRTRLRTYTNISQDYVLSSWRRRHSFYVTPSQRIPRRRHISHDGVRDHDPVHYLEYSLS